MSQKLEYTERQERHCAADLPREVSLDGVVYAEIDHASRRWRMASIVPGYREELLHLGMDPKEEDLSRLAHQGIFLNASTTTVPTAVMCEGMGAVWPHMGRELYEQFPEARAAMDRIQSIASWDVLALLDCDDPDHITATRWQIPYLFLVEYAEWCTLTSLGFTPSLVCGHSLGELIALCCAGIYSYEVAFYILDKRAEYVSAMKACAEKECGMLAVHAEYPVVKEVLEQNPDVRVANYNTPRQFILGGSKDTLQEIRRSLRKRRIPAVAIPVSLLFHHPQMRILRDISLRRLNILPMRKADIPVMGVANCGLYPDTQAGICTTIADLDENPVRWTECVQKMWQEHGIRRFVEIGPQDILCGLVMENLPDARVYACNRKGHEAKAMRTLCASLFAQGLLSERLIWSRAHPVDPAWRTEKADTLSGTDPADAAETQETGIRRTSVARDAETDQMLQNLATLTGRERQELVPELDLRNDLGLRSSSFPWLITQAEQIFHREIAFEELLHVVTLGDFIRVLHGEAPDRAPAEQRTALPRPEPVMSLARRSPSVFCEQRYLKRYPDGSVLSEAAGRLCLNVQETVLSEDPVLLSDLLDSFFPCLEEIVCGKRISQAVRDAVPDTVSFLTFEDRETHGRDTCDAIRVCIAEGTASVEELLRLLAPLELCQKDGVSSSPLMLLRIWKNRESALAGFLEDRVAGKSCSGQFHCIEYVKDVRRHFQELGALFAHECLLGEFPHVLWGSAEITEEVKASAGAHIPVRDQFGKREQGQDFLEDIPHLPPPCAPLSKTGQYTIVPGRPGGEFSPARRMQGAVVLNRTALTPFCAGFPLSICLETLSVSTRMLLPWMSVQGFTDISVHHLPGPDIADLLEGRILAQSLTNLNMDQSLTRQCQGELSFSAVNGLGRKELLVPCMQGTVLLARDRLSMRKFVGEQSSAEIPGQNVGERTDLSEHGRQFFAEAGWTLHRLELCSENELFCVLSCADPAEDFPSPFAMRMDACSLFAGFVLAADLGRSGCTQTFESVCSDWALCQIGYIVFGAAYEGERFSLTLRRTVQEPSLERFDIECASLSGPVELCITHFEWQRRT